MIQLGKEREVLIRSIAKLHYTASVERRCPSWLKLLAVSFQRLVSKAGGLTDVRPPKM